MRRDDLEAGQNPQERQREYWSCSLSLNLYCLVLPIVALVSLLLPDPSFNM